MLPMADSRLLLMDREKKSSRVIRKDGTNCFRSGKFWLHKLQSCTIKFAALDGT